MSFETPFARASVIEALLLWRLEQDASKAIDIAKAKGLRNANKTLEEWDLAELIQVAAALGPLKADSSEHTSLSREFRNLIHPGRAKRLNTRCDRATALAVAAGVEFVIRDLS